MRFLNSNPEEMPSADNLRVEEQLRQEEGAPTILDSGIFLKLGSVSLVLLYGWILLHCRI